MAVGRRAQNRCATQSRTRSTAPPRCCTLDVAQRDICWTLAGLKQWAMERCWPMGYAGYQLPQKQRLRQRRPDALNRIAPFFLGRTAFLWPGWRAKSRSTSRKLVLPLFLFLSRSLAFILASEFNAVVPRSAYSSVSFSKPPRALIPPSVQLRSFPSNVDSIMANMLAVPCPRNPYIPLINPYHPLRTRIPV